MSTSFDVEAVDLAIGKTRFYGGIHHFPSVGSTNHLALEAGSCGERNGVWVADEQTAGRGRGSHSWHSAPGDGLYVSALVSPRLPVAWLSKLPLATGLAARGAIFDISGLQPDIRWPNDLLFGERKCGGILVESASEAARDAGRGATLRYAVIGVGINVNQTDFPDDLAAIATSLRLESGRRYQREALLAALLRSLDTELSLLESSLSRGESAEDLSRRVETASTWVRGKRVTVDEGGGYTGSTCGLNSEGFLLVQGDDGVIRTVLSGGVRPA